jgi:MSHA pilin protein MshD
MDMRHSESGLTLVELVISIVVIGLAVTTVLLVMNLTTRRSADPMIEHQALAIADAYLEEITLLPFDESAASGASEGALGPDAGEAGRADYDDVNDYDGHVDTGARTLAAPGAVIPGLESYTVSVTVTGDGNLGPTGQKVPSGDAVLVSVRVSHPDAGDVTLSAYRTRH